MLVPGKAMIADVNVITCLEVFAIAFTLFFSPLPLSVIAPITFLPKALLPQPKSATLHCRHCAVEWEFDFDSEQS